MPSSTRRGLHGVLILRTRSRACIARLATLGSVLVGVTLIVSY
jgi:hypothetical protein